MKRPAYTLVELMVTVLVLALLAAFTIPTYQLILSQAQLNSAVEDISDFVRLAAQKTVTEQQIYGITLNAHAVSIPMFQVQGSDQVQTQTLSLPANMQIETVSLNGQDSVTFTPSGAPSVSGSFTVKDTIRNRTRTIEIRPSGSIKNNQSEQ